MIRNVEDSAKHFLLIDTCGAVGSLAIAKLRPDARVLAQAAVPGRATSERLLPTIRELLDSNGLALDGLGGIGIVSGPGSFTGIRVGLSAAKGLCEALSIPLIAISRLAVLAGKSAASDVLALLEAGRGELYAGRYLAGDLVREALASRAQVIALAEVVGGPRLVASEDAVIAAFPDGAVERVEEPAAADALPHALARFCRQSFEDVAGLDGNYVRRTDLEIFAKQIRQPAAAQ